MNTGPKSFFLQNVQIRYYTKQSCILEIELPLLIQMQILKKKDEKTYIAMTKAVFVSTNLFLAIWLI